MADLVSYIRQQQQAGYDINAIRAALLKYGYPQADIDAAIRQAYAVPQPTYAPPAEVKHVIHISPTVIIAIVVVFVVAIGGFFALSSLSRKAAVPKQLLDLKAEITSTSIYQGTNLRFNVEALNLGAARRYDIQLRYLISDSAGKIIKTKEETIALDTRVSTSAQVQLPPAIKPGSYQLKVIAKYDTNIATATENFIVYEKVAEEPEAPEPEPEPTLPTVPTPTAPVSCDDGDPCTRDSVVGTECTHAPITPCCGNNNCEAGENFDSCPEDCPPSAEEDPFAGMTLWETLDKIEDIALTKPKDAAKYCPEFEDQEFQDKCYSRVAESAKSETYCNSIVGEREKDKCLRQVAKSSGNVLICDRIISDVTRDSCYMDFVTQGNYEICDKVTNTYHKNSCETLKKYGIHTP